MTHVDPSRGRVIDFTSPIVEERFAVFALACDDFVEKLNANAPAEYRAGCDDAVVYDVFASTYTDINRYKEWHLPDALLRSDAIKRAAFYTKWIVRLRPLFAIRSGYVSSVVDRSVLLNERFAIEWAWANLSFELGRRVSAPSEKKYFELLYDLHYRHLDGDALIHIYQYYFDSAQGAAIFVHLDGT